jgi:hypothetical protein
MALATSKRKFYKLLDDLSGANKRSSTDTPSSSADRPSKRSRTLATATFRAGSRDGPGAPGRANSGRTTVRLLSSTFESRAGLSGAPPTAATTSATTATAGTGANAAAAAATPAQARLGGLPATYAPWSHEQFLDRLRTFADVKRWRPKPPAVGEVAWARRGWEVVGDDEVACSFCGRHVVLRLDGGGGGGGGEHEGDGGGNASEDKWWTVEAEEKLVAKYEALVVSGHSEECLWRAAGCKGLFALIVVAWANMLQTTSTESSLGTKVTSRRNSSSDTRPYPSLVPHCQPKLTSHLQYQAKSLHLALTTWWNGLRRCYTMVAAATRLPSATKPRNQTTMAMLPTRPTSAPYCWLFADGAGRRLPTFPSQRAKSVLRAWASGCINRNQTPPKTP